MLCTTRWPIPCRIPIWMPRTFPRAFRGAMWVVSRTWPTVWISTFLNIVVPAGKFTWHEDGTRKKVEEINENCVFFFVNHFSFSECFGFLCLSIIINLIGHMVLCLPWRTASRLLVMRLAMILIYRFNSFWIVVPKPRVPVMEDTTLPPTSLFKRRDTFPTIRACPMWRVPMNPRMAFVLMSIRPAVLRQPARHVIPLPVWEESVWRWVRVQTKNHKDDSFWESLSFICFYFSPTEYILILILYMRNESILTLLL